MRSFTQLIKRKLLSLKGLISVLILLLILSSFSVFSAVFRKAPYLLFDDSNTKIQICWQLDASAYCTVNYGLTAEHGSTVSTSEYGIDHQHKCLISNLDVNTLYYYEVTISGGPSVTGSFRTGADDNATSTSFYAYGDTRSHPDIHNSVCSRIVEDFTANPADHTFVIVSGDLVSDGNNEAIWDSQLFRPQDTKIREMMGSLPYMVSMGNHEGNGSLFAKYFPYKFYTAGRFYYSFDDGPAHFTIVDQYTEYSAGSAQYNWIVSDLSKSTKKWKFILLHEPGWSAGGMHGNNTDVQTRLQPLAETYGVQFFIAGHNHYYARATVNNVQHITTGGGGAPLYNPDPSYSNIVKTDKSYHFCRITINGDRLDFTAIRSDGTTIESFTIYNTLITPVFNQIGSLCQNSTPPTLPATSINGISGTWSPSRISSANPGTTVYTFVPNPGQNAVNTKMSIAILGTPIVTNNILSQTVNTGSVTVPVHLTSSVTGTTFNWTASASSGISGYQPSGTGDIPSQVLINSGTTTGTVTCSITPSANGCIGPVTNYTFTVNPNNAPPVVFEKSIILGSDDAEEYNARTMVLTEPDLELVYNSKTTGNQKVGLRFTEINIPKGAIIESATIRFTASKVSTGTANLTVHGQAADNPLTFTTAKKNISNRTKTSASVPWKPGTWTPAGSAQLTPELKTIVQELVNSTGWISGNSMVFIISGTGTRIAYAYDKSVSEAAKLHVEYSTPVSMAKEKKATTITDQSSDAKLTCYPVPFTNVLNISFEPAGKETLQFIAIYGVSGSLMKSIHHPDNELSVGFENYTPGIYMVGAQTDQNQYVKTVVKQ